MELQDKIPPDPKLNKQAPINVDLAQFEGDIIFNFFSI